LKAVFIDDDDDDGGGDAMQLEVLKRNVDRAASDLESVRVQIKQTKKEIASKQLRYVLHIIIRQIDNATAPSRQSQTVSSVTVTFFPNVFVLCSPLMGKIETILKTFKQYWQASAR